MRPPTKEQIQEFTKEEQALNDLFVTGEYSLINKYYTRNARETEGRIRSFIKHAQKLYFDFFTKLQALYNPIVISIGYPDAAF
jgi:hypothetical protein